jgi:hypothetical protein
VDTEEKFVEYINQALKDADAFSTDAAVEQVKGNVSLLAAQVFSKREWPDTLWPMGDMKLTLAKLYKSYDNHPQAGIYAMQGCLADTLRGPQWVDDLHQLLQLITPIVVLGQKGRWAIEPGFPSTRQLWDFFHGLLHELKMQSKKTYGGDASYSKVIANWYSDGMDAAADKPLPGQTGFPKRFNEAQSKLLSWANVDVSRRVVLSSSHRT